MKNINQLKKEVLKKLFVILPFEEADNLKIVRKSAEKIIEGRYVGLDTIEKAIDLTLQEVCVEVNKLNFDEIDRKGMDKGCTFEDMVKKELLKKFQGEEK